MSFFKEIKEKVDKKIKKENELYYSNSKKLMYSWLKIIITKIYESIVKGESHCYFFNGFDSSIYKIKENNINKLLILFKYNNIKGIYEYIGDGNEKYTFRWEQNIDLENIYNNIKSILDTFFSDFEKKAEDKSLINDIMNTYFDRFTKKEEVENNKPKKSKKKK